MGLGIIGDVVSGLGNMLGIGTTANNQTIYGTTAKGGGLVTSSTAMPGAQPIYQNGAFTDYALKNFDAQTLNGIKPDTSMPNQPSALNQTVTGLGQLGNLYSSFKDIQYKKDLMNMYKEDRDYKRKREKELSDGAKSLGHALAQ